MILSSIIIICEHFEASRLCIMVCSVIAGGRGVCIEAMGTVVVLWKKVLVFMHLQTFFQM